jgi:hypothetical protein
MAVVLQDLKLITMFREHMRRVREVVGTGLKQLQYHAVLRLACEASLVFRNSLVVVLLHIIGCVMGREAEC